MGASVTKTLNSYYFRRHLDKDRGIGWCPLCIPDGATATHREVSHKFPETVFDYYACTHWIRWDFVQTNERNAKDRNRCMECGLLHDSTVPMLENRVEQMKRDVVHVAVQLETKEMECEMLLRQQEILKDRNAGLQDKITQETDKLDLAHRVIAELEHRFKWKQEECRRRETEIERLVMPRELAAPSYVDSMNRRCRKLQAELTETQNLLEDVKLKLVKSEKKRKQESDNSNTKRSRT